VECAADEEPNDHIIDGLIDISAVSLYQNGALMRDMVYVLSGTLHTCCFQPHPVYLTMSRNSGFKAALFFELLFGSLIRLYHPRPQFLSATFPFVSDNIGGIEALGCY
jgi:hypothetical protein